MKNIFYILIISVLFSCNISYPMEQSITIQKMSMLMCITAVCGSLYIANQYKNSILHWFKSLYHKISMRKNDDPVDSKPTGIQTNQQNTSEQQQILIIPQLTKDVLEQKTTQYLQKKENERKENIEGTTELHTACKNNDAQKVRSLLQDLNTDINAKRNCSTYCSKELGETPLHIACQNKNREIVDLLLSCNSIDINIQNNDEDTPLHIACKIGDLEIVQKLLSCNTLDINKQSNYKTAIYFSYFHDHKDIFLLLFNQKNIDLEGLLSLACKRHDTDMINQLLNHKNIRLDDNRPLFIACENGNSDIVTLLLQHNKNNCMNINALIYGDYHGYNPLLIACKKIDGGNPKRTEFVTIIKALLNDPYIDINQKTGTGFTVFHFAAADYEILQLLLAKDSRFISEKDNTKDTGGSSNYQDYIQTTPLHNAITAGNLKCISLLLKHGADISIENYFGKTPLSLACVKASQKIQKYQKIVEQLLTSSHVNQETINSSECLYYSILKDDTGFDIPKLLLSCGANPNKRSDKYGSSPLLKAAEYNLPLLNLCIDTYGGDCNQQNNRNRTVLYMAFMSKKINNPNEINFFKGLSKDEKKEFMTRELTIVANFTPKNIFMKYSWNISSIQKEINDDIKLFYSFVAACIHHGKIDLNAKISNDITLLDNAYKKLEERHNNFHSNDNCWIKCMKLDICCYTHDRWNHKSYDGCEDCRQYFPYNELVVHALIQHITPTTIERAIDKTIATTYKEEPSTYYLKEPQDKETQKNCIREMIKMK